MKKVYIVKDGDYSDYRIVAVFSTEEKAKEYIQTTGEGDDYVEVEVDGPYERQARVWRIDMRISDHEVTYLGVERYYDNVEDCIRVRRRFGGMRGDELSLWVKADTQERAVKIANERIGQVLAGAYIYYKKAFLADGNDECPYVNYHTGEVVKANYHLDWQD